MDARHATAASRKSARNHYIGALYHDAFYGSRKGTQVGLGEDQISPMTANTLIRNKAAILHIDNEGNAYLGATKTGSRIYGSSTTFRVFSDFSTGASEVFSTYPRYMRGIDIDILEVMRSINAHFPGILRRL